MTRILRHNIVIPAYNESERLGPTLDRLLAFVRQQVQNAEIVVVNVGSADQTADIVRNYAEQSGGIIRMLENSENRGARSELQTRRQSLARQPLGRVVNGLLRVLLRLKFKDTQCGFKPFRREAARAVFALQRIEGWGFDAEILFLAEKSGFKVAEVPVVWATTPELGLSHSRTVGAC